MNIKRTRRIGKKREGDGRESVYGKMGDRQDESLCVHGSRRVRDGCHCRSWDVVLTRAGARLLRSGIGWRWRSTQVGW